MKLCHVVPSLQEQHGGPSKSVRALCQALAQAGHTVELLTTSPDAPDEGQTTGDEANLRIRTFRRNAPQRLCLARGLRAAVLRTDAEVIHHHGLWLRTLHYARQGAARGGVPLVISPRGMMSRWAWRHHGWKKRLSRLLIHPHALDAATGWHATSPEEKNEIETLGYSQPVCVAPNGVAEPAPAELIAARTFWAQQCPDVAARRTALFYGRFHEKKRVLELIDVWLARAPSDWLLLLVGLPEDYTPEMLEQYVQKQSAAGRVRAFSGGGRPAPYAVASLFLLASHNENFGLTVAEAMAHGVPALVTDTTPWSQLNTEDRGWCVPWSRYGDALATATSEPDSSLKSRGARARAWVLDAYSWERAARVLTDFYATLPARCP